jgi:hypothetical protein
MTYSDKRLSHDLTFHHKHHVNLPGIESGLPLTNADRVMMLLISDRI